MIIIPKLICDYSVKNDQQEEYVNIIQNTAHAQGLLSSRNIFDVQINCHPLTSPIPAGSQLSVTVGSIYVGQVDHDRLQDPLSQCTSSVGLGLPRDFASTSSETLYT